MTLGHLNLRVFIFYVFASSLMQKSQTFTEQVVQAKPTFLMINSLFDELFYWFGFEILTRGVGYCEFLFFF